MILVYDALRLKNTIQVIGLCIYNLGILVYASIQIDQINDAVVVLEENGLIMIEFWGEIKPFLIVEPCLMAFGTILMSFVAWKLYDEFAWTIYKHISADLRLKRRYLTYQARLHMSHAVSKLGLTLDSRFTLPCSSSTFSSSLDLPSSFLSSSEIRLMPNSTLPLRPCPSPSCCWCWQLIGRARRTSSE